mmetsp:Transcript_88709/g.271635  ORF Transcript_88709/g.271635 Transcript_88709/m.271635 type:complete len:213 (+) Transcript_88709:884-1522(+)
MSQLIFKAWSCTPHTSNPSFLVIMKSCPLGANDTDCTVLGPRKLHPQPSKTTSAPWRTPTLATRSCPCSASSPASTPRSRSRIPAMRSSTPSSSSSLAMRAPSSKSLAMRSPAFASLNSSRGGGGNKLSFNLRAAHLRLRASCSSLRILSNIWLRFFVTSQAPCNATSPATEPLLFRLVPSTYDTCREVAAATNDMSTTLAIALKNHNECFG